MVVQERVVRQELEQVEQVEIVVHQVQVEHRAFKERKDNKVFQVQVERVAFKEQQVKD